MLTLNWNVQDYCGVRIHNFYLCYFVCASWFEVKLEVSDCGLAGPSSVSAAAKSTQS